MPKVSIIIPFFNREQFVIATLNSVLYQRYENFEAILIDDGSSPESFNVIKEYVSKDKRIKIVKRNILPKGPSTCRNIGIENATGDFLMFLDSDDILSKTCIENRIKAISTDELLDFVVYNSMLFEKSEKFDDLNIYWNIDSIESDLSRFLRFDGVWAINGPLYKMSFIRKYRFNTQISLHEDAELALQILLHRPYYTKYLNQSPDVFIRWQFENSVSRSSKNYDDYLLKTIQVANLMTESVKIQSENDHFRYKSSLIQLHYGLSKEALNCRNKRFLIKTALSGLKHHGFRVYLYFMLLYFLQNIIFLTTNKKGKIITKLRISLRKLLDLFIAKTLNVKQSTLCKIRKDAE